MYRGQDIGSRDRLIQRCLQAIRERSAEALKQLLPHIAIFRPSELKDPLQEWLKTGTLRHKEVAAIALGSLEDPSVIGPLRQSLESEDRRRGRGYEAFLAAVILALGEVGHGDAVPVLLELYRCEHDRHLQVQRRQLVLLALGSLAHQGSKRAETELHELLEKGDDLERIDALQELAGAYWSRPQEVPKAFIEQLGRLADRFPEEEEIGKAALIALQGLAEVGCKQAEEYFGAQTA
ncbi:MAG TPA: HEAT repeat domain-containing protein [Acidobacteriota bacterium]|nr:HEAT repeat domain-containing protein [Acidobacteriota bacterium]